MTGSSSGGMVDVSSKTIIPRFAKACGKIKLRRETINLILDDAIEKGDVFEDTKIVALQAVKDAHRILPYCHNIPIEWVGFTARVVSRNSVEICVSVKTTAKTGAEMEALCGVLAALANVWDMVKKYEKDQKGQYPYTYIYDVRVVEKTKNEPE